jgi:hypothetical protein
MSGPWWRAFLCGVAQILDLGGTMAPKREDIGFHHDARDDAQAIRSDWEAVGRDFETVLRTGPKEKTK